jgi:hypothetical protein
VDAPASLPFLPACLSCLVLFVQRRLLQSRVDLYITVTYPGTSKGGVALVAACKTDGTSNCLSKVVVNGQPLTVEVIGSAIQPVALADLGDASVTLVQQPYVPGQPVYFTATYKIGNTPTEAAVVLTTIPSSVLSCSATDGGTGVTQCTCRPLLSQMSGMQVIANGPNPKIVTTPVKDVLTISNASKWQFVCRLCRIHLLGVIDSVV